MMDSKPWSSFETEIPPVPEEPWVAGEGDLDAYLDHLDRMLSLLEDLAEADQAAPDKQLGRLAIERVLQLAVQDVLYAAYYLLVTCYGTPPGSHGDAIEQIAARGVIGESLHGRLSGLGQFRNLLFHGIPGVDFDRDLIVETLPRGVQDFTAFAREIRAWLEKTRP